VTAWYEESFGRDYLALYPHRDCEEAVADIGAIVDLIAPPRDEPLLDLCCGAGRHLQALHRLGFSRLTGIDLSQPLLDVARRELDSVGARDIRLMLSDMREIPFREAFETVISLFTSFGYFTDSAEDERVLLAVFGALRPGGAFLMDTLNRERTIIDLVPHSEKTVNGLTVDITRRVTPDGLRVEKETRIVSEPSTQRVYRESVRMYSSDELRLMLEQSGFVDIRFHGSVDGRPYCDESPRMVATARRPTAT